MILHFPLLFSMIHFNPESNPSFNMQKKSRSKNVIVYRLNQNTSIKALYSPLNLFGKATYLYMWVPFCKHSFLKELINTFNFRQKKEFALSDPKCNNNNLQLLIHQHLQVLVWFWEQILCINPCYLTEACGCNRTWVRLLKTAAVTEIENQGILPFKNPQIESIDARRDKPKEKSP